VLAAKRNMTEDYIEPPNTNPDTETTYHDLLVAPETHPSLHPILHRLAGQDTGQRAAPSPPNLVENREVAHEALFQGELPYEPQPDEQDIGLSGLWRAHTRKSGLRGEIVDSHFDEIPKIVEAILSNHEKLSRSPEGANGAAMFSFLNPEIQEIVTEITTGAIKNWELALFRNEQPFLLRVSNEHLDDISNERLAHLVGMQSLVIETAAAVMESLPAFIKNPAKPTKTQKEDLSKIISNWGPNFVKEWFSGKIIEEHFRQSGLDDAEIREWLDTFTPGMLRYFAVGNINNPMEALDRVKANLDSLSDEAIAERLGWSEEESREIITPGIRRQLAVGNISNPMEALDRVKANLESLNDEAIAERLGWSEEESREIITPGIRHQLAVNNITDPMEALDRVRANLESLNDEAIAERLGWSEEEAREIITPGMRRRFAVNNITDPMEALDRVRANLESLNDQAIAERLGWSEEEAREIITPGIRRHFAVKNINDPFSGLIDYIDGRIQKSGTYYSGKRRVLPPGEAE